MLHLSRPVALVAGPAIGLLSAGALSAAGLESAAAITGGITALCVAWWILEPIPIPVTSMIPLALLPLFGVLSARQVSAAYGDKLVLLLLGGFILSTAVAGSGAHRRLALNMVKLFGGASARRLVFGFMAASALLSMWISNTATSLMLLPVALAVLEKSRDRALAIPLLLGVAYAASIGGIGTPIGTPPNAEFRAVYERTFGEEVTFLQWMIWGLPLVLVMLPLAGLWLTRSLKDSEPIEIPEVGPWTVHERRVMIVFVLTAIAWVTRREPFGGWSTILGVPGANDAVVALLAVAVMFIVPNGKGGQLLDWETASKIPWGMLILFGAGLSIALAFTESGLSESLASGLGILQQVHPIVLILVICAAVTFLTETTSNTATTALLMPILAAAALAAHVDPLLLMVPAAMSASCAFMLPVATPPNIVVSSSGLIPIHRMVREGVVLNLIGILAITGLMYLLI